MSPTEKQTTLLQRYTEACNYPGALDDIAVERHLRRYLDAIGVKRKIHRLQFAWGIHQHPSLLRYVQRVLEDFASRNPTAARAAMAARDAMDARGARAARALQRFTSWCIYRGGWWWYSELSWLATTYIGAVQLKKASVKSWAEPVFEAFVAGAWILHFTEDTLYWVAKPKVHVEPITPGNGRRLHNSSYAAVESDLENIYFWHGVLVPAFVVTYPQWITLTHIQDEANAEVRRVMIERYGLSRYLLDSGAKKLAEDEFGELYSTEIPGDESLVMVKVLNSTAESDGSYKPYFLRVHPELRPLLADRSTGPAQKLTPLNAVASTFGLTGREYLESLVAQT